MPLLVPVVKILKKIGVTGKIWEKTGVKHFRDLTVEKINFSTLATSNIRLLLFFGEEDQQTKLVGLVRKKVHGHRRKTRENDNFLTKQSPFLSPNFIRGSIYGDCNSS